MPKRRFFSQRIPGKTPLHKLPDAGGPEPLHMALVPAEAEQNVASCLKRGNFSGAREMAAQCGWLGFKREERVLLGAIKTAESIEIALRNGNIKEAKRLLRNLKRTVIVPKNKSLPWNPIPAFEAKIKARERQV